MATGSHHIDSCILSSGKIVDIEGLTNEIKLSKLNGRSSGHTTLTISGATIQDGILSVPEGAAIETTKIDRLGNSRNLSGQSGFQTIGTKKVFVIRADALDASVTSDIGIINL
jgi:hypothetical protein